VTPIRQGPHQGRPDARIVLDEGHRSHGDQIRPEVKAERNSRLLAETTRVGLERSRRLVGQTVEVMVDGVSKKGNGELAGRTRCNRVVNFVGQRGVAPRDLVSINVTEVLPHSLRGTLAPRAEDAECSSK